MFHVPLKCGNCANLVDFEFRHIVDYTARTPDEIKLLGQPRNASMGLSMRMLNDTDRITGSAHTHCPRCFHPSLVLYECTRATHEGISRIIQNREGNLMGGPGAVSIKAYYPTPKTADQSPFWPESLRRIFADAQDMLAEGKSPSIVLATARSVLELALKEIDDEPKLTLYQRIEQLHAKGIITSPVKDWAHDIRLDGNAGTHSGSGDQASAAEYIEFLKLFLDMSFSLPERIKEKRNPAI